MLFLLNDQLIEPADATPGTNPNFPLSPSQFAALNLNDIVALAREEFMRDPDFARTKPVAARNLAGLITAKSQANALRLYIIDPAAGTAGVGFNLANLSLEAMADLMARDQGGDLTMAYVNLAIWSAVEAAAPA